MQQQTSDKKHPGYREEDVGQPASAPQAAETLVDLLLQRASRTPDQLAYAFVRDQGEPVSLTYGELYAQAAGFAVLLQQHELEGERVLLVFKSNQYFIIAFFACLMAGAIAVPTSPPRREHLTQRLELLAKNAGARAGIPDSDEVMQAAIAFGHGDLQWFDIRQLSQQEKLRELAPKWVKPDINGETLAFLQYTSGTTGDPKGVMINHRNILCNSAMIEQSFGHGADSVGLVALPLFHDMGLIGGVLQPLYAGFPVYLMTPVQLIQNPQRWLQLISRYRVTTTGGPNFMYDLATRSTPDEGAPALDLSCWRVAFCGAEPVRNATANDFVNRFASVGFRRASFFPCYGMAESTLLVTAHRLDCDYKVDLRSAESGLPPLVSCGAPLLGTRVLIVDPGTRLAMAAGVEGEIWVSSDCNSPGYWKRPELSAEVFGAQLAEPVDSGGQGPFLRTGDLGYLRDGELFVTGRIKDLVIVHGRNYAPQDLELEAEQSHAGLRSLASAAFTITEQGRERLVLACELRRELLRRPQEWPSVESAVRSGIAGAYQLRVDDVVLMHTGTLPRTSSGKVRRAQCRLDYLAGRLPHARDLRAGATS